MSIHPRYTGGFRLSQVQDRQGNSVQPITDIQYIRVPPVTLIAAPLM